MSKDEFIKMIEKEQSRALNSYNFHLRDGNRYGLLQWFNGQRAMLRRLKRKIKKL